MTTAQTAFTIPDLATVRAEAADVDSRAVLSAGADQVLPASPPAVALALFTDPDVSTEELKLAAERRVAGPQPRLHPVLPPYPPNHLHSQCKMCRMRKGNTRLIRKFAGKRELEEQLAILYEDEGVRGVGFLTGEYADKYTRLVSTFRIGWAIRRALDMGFRRVYYNIGSMEADEIDV